MNVPILIVILIIVSAAVAYWFWRKRESKIEKDKFDAFIAGADKIYVSLDDVEIKSNSWKEETFLNDSASKLDQLAGDPGKGTEVIHRHLNTLIFTVPYKNSRLRITESVSMERKTLEMKLAIKEETSLYLNPKNPKEYYLDLDFLK